MVNKWKKTNKPTTCTKAPWEFLIPFKLRPKLMRQIKQECIDIYGYSMEECPKRKVCLKKECLGRPLPWKSETAKPYLEKLKETIKIENDELFIQTDCSKCPIVTKCKSLCSQIEDFINRDKTVEPTIYYTNNTTKVIPEQNKNISIKKTLFVNGEDIPWDCVSLKKQKVIKKYLYEQLDFKYIAEQLNITNQAYCKYEFYSALTKLSEYAVMRKFIKDNFNILTGDQKKLLTKIYIKNKNFTEVAQELNISRQAVQQRIKRIIKKYNLQWKKYVTKKNNIPIYTVPELFK